MEKSQQSNIRSVAHELVDKILGKDETVDSGMSHEVLRKFEEFERRIIELEQKIFSDDVNPTVEAVTGDASATPPSNPSATNVTPASTVSSTDPTGPASAPVTDPTAASASTSDASDPSGTTSDPFSTPTTGGTTT